MVGVLVEQEGEISLMARSKCAFVHAQDIYVLTECGGNVSSFPHTHTSFPVEDLPLRRTARTGFLQQKSLFEGDTQ